MTGPEREAEPGRARVEGPTEAGGAPGEPAPADPRPRQVGRYRILGLLGAGGMGSVYKAEDASLGRLAAVKIPLLTATPEDRERAAQRFLREARAAAAVRHPHVCPIYDVGEQDGWPYVVMAYIDGRSLADRLNGGRIDDPREAVRLARQVAEALTAVHAHGIVHRDLKPGNILLDAAGQAILTDFGLAHSADSDRLTVTGAVLGTPAYMAPEQAAGKTKEVGPAADVYALGAVLYECLTGRPAYQAATPLATLAQVLLDDPAPPSQHRPDLDPGLEAVVLRAMARRPEDRFLDARAFTDALRRWEEGAPAPAAPPEPAAAPPGKAPVSGRDLPAPRRRGRRLAVAAAAVAVLLGASIPLAYWATTRHPERAPAPSPPPPDEKPVNERADSGPPRVHIGFDVETDGVVTKMELPFVVGVLADLSGQPAQPLPPLKERKFVAIDRDHFDQVLEQAAPRLALTVPDRLGGGDQLAVELSFRRLEDFKPLAVARQVDALKMLLDARRAAESAEPSDVKRISDIDKKLSAQLAAILHHPDFRRLEATWRGLYLLVDTAGTGDRLKVRVLNVSKGELLNDADKAVDFDQTVLFRKVYEEEFGQLGGEPYGLLVGDYEFGRDDADVRLLQSVADVAAYAHAPFVAAASPALFGVERFADLQSTRGLAALFAGPEHAAWRAFRDSDSSRYVGLTLPHVLARIPYGSEFYRIDGFDFEESVEGRDQDALVWMSAAWAFAAQVTDAYARSGWPARIAGWEGGGRVVGVPIFAFPAENGEGKVKRSTDVSVWGRREAELSGLGFLPLLHGSGQAEPAFMAAQSCHNPRASPDLDPADASRLDVLLCGSRYVHTLQVMARDKIGAFVERRDCERWLNDWLNGYVLADPAGADESALARRPLASARLEVRELRAKPGWYEIVFHLRPRYQLEPEPTAPVRLTAEVPVRQ
jgi:type VI secretion system protein ImpC